MTVFVQTPIEQRIDLVAPLAAVTPPEPVATAVDTRRCLTVSRFSTRRLASCLVSIAPVFFALLNVVTSERMV